MPAFSLSVIEESESSSLFLTSSDVMRASISSLVCLVVIAVGAVVVGINSASSTGFSSDDSGALEVDSTSRALALFPCDFALLLRFLDFARGVFARL